MTGPKQLLIHMGGRLMGKLRQDPHGRLSFSYDQQWRVARSATPLSLSMPLTRVEHPHAVVDPFVRGLLPDSDRVLQRWGRQFGVSPNSPFALLTHVGEDVAGAAQFIRPDRVEQADADGGIEPVDDAYIARRLRALGSDRSAWDDFAAPGQFSLAGAQAKFALYRSSDGQWGLPTGRTATTHILKPPLEHLADQEINEHLCLRAASKLGLRSALSQVMTFDGEPAIVLTRYDRVIRPDGSVTRVHQEDFCQALAVHPDRKYERQDGGPGAVAIVDLLRRVQPPSVAAASIETFSKALAYNWVIYGPDAHAKNYALLLSGPQVALAPLYDISSTAPYPDRFDPRHMAMAMGIGGKYENALVTSDDWRGMAVKFGVAPDDLLTWVYDIVANAPDALADAVREEGEWLAGVPVARDLVAGVGQSSQALLKWFRR
ncbi:type II toxin-antitoxin system HipA family toxin [Jatrophihabitans lederbergiae]|uniref:Type II toxin-antitoxin system HipA family toxin n=1 Tax=Jatrophihabitans lederbergiae TaxID=3075547 RepID=A0ABU2JDF0_9ACTN|nr:type II toxin-antitoxin system HipA family toxin [Jatrophihabitans sp. DSM 44399]MDT0263005.1 type II toxin-antitoxin system HipA family toxin [Jatrophihabitans sp. DSM 44399]